MHTAPIKLPRYGKWQSVDAHKADVLVWLFIIIWSYIYQPIYVACEYNLATAVIASNGLNFQGCYQSECGSLAGNFLMSCIGDGRLWLVVAASVVEADAMHNYLAQHCHCLYNALHSSIVQIIKLLGPIACRMSGCWVSSVRQWAWSPLTTPTC